jgi:hypothetical protein
MFESLSLQMKCLCLKVYLCKLELCFHHKILEYLASCFSPKYGMSTFIMLYIIVYFESWV